MARQREINLEICNLQSQEEVFYKTKEQFVVVPKGRRAGFTRGAAQYVIDCMLDGKSVLWVDTVQANLNQYFALYFFPLLKQLPREMWDYKQSTHNLTINNTKLHMRSAERPENIEGFAYHLIILNEAGIILKGNRGRQLWLSSILPMIMDYNPFVYIIGTPKGKRAKKGELSNTSYCLYYELALKGTPGSEYYDPDWKTMRYPSNSNPTLSTDALAELAKEIPPILRKQEMEGEFLDFGEGQEFKEEWFLTVTETPEKYQRVILSLDTAFKTTQTADYSAGVILAETHNQYYWLDCFNEKLEFGRLIDKTLEFYQMYNPDLILIEDAASGQSIIQQLKNETRLSIRAIRPDRDKLSRARAVTPLLEQGKVYLKYGPWNKMAINQFMEFSAAMDMKDDIIDAFSQGLLFLAHDNINNKPVSIKRDTDRIIRKRTILQGYPRGI